MSENNNHAEEPVEIESGDEYSDDDFDPMSQISQLLVTEDGVPITDVLVGIRDALDKLVKIHYKMATVLETKLQ